MTQEVALATLKVEPCFGMSRNPAQDFFTFLLGGGLFAGGIFLLLNQVMVSSLGGIGFGGFGRWGGGYRPGLRYGYGGGWGIPSFGGVSGGMGLYQHAIHADNAMVTCHHDCDDRFGCGIDV